MKKIKTFMNMSISGSGLIFASFSLLESSINISKIGHNRQFEVYPVSCVSQKLQIRTKVTVHYPNAISVLIIE